jgi:plastocyanin
MSGRIKSTFLALALGYCAISSEALAVMPGVDIAAPRVATTTASGFSFTPSSLVVEQADHVLWTWGAGTHTTTSGAPCVANGLWSSSLDSVTTSFGRQFLEPPGQQPFFCVPHCALGMQGVVTVTTLIDVKVTDVSGATELDWTGGGGRYRIFRADAPKFAAGTVVLADTTTLSFLDTVSGSPAAGKAFYYLVMNQF